MTSREDQQIQIEIMKLEIIQKQNELRVLKQQLKILEIKQGKMPDEPMPCPKLVQDQIMKVAEQDLQQPGVAVHLPQQEEDERATKYYVVTKGPKIGIHKEFAKIKDLPVSYYEVKNSIKEAEEFYDKSKTIGLLQKAQIQRLNPSRIACMQSRLIKQTVSKEEWKNLYNVLSKSTTEDQLIPISRQDWLKGIALENIDGEKLVNMFNAGLIDIIYPTMKLEELCGLPKLKQAIQLYADRRQFKQQSRNLYIKVLSTIPDWEDEKDYPSYHLIKIGAAGNYTIPKNYEVQEEIITENSLTSRREDSFYHLYQELATINSASQLKVNYVTEHVIVISMFNKKVSKADMDRITAWKEKVEKQPRVSSTTKERLSNILEASEEYMDHKMTAMSV